MVSNLMCNCKVPIGEISSGDTSLRFIRAGLFSPSLYISVQSLSSKPFNRTTVQYSTGSISSSIWHSSLAGIVFFFFFFFFLFQGCWLPLHKYRFLFFFFFPCFLSTTFFIVSPTRPLAALVQLRTCRRVRDQSFPIHAYVCIYTYSTALTLLFIIHVLCTYGRSGEYSRYRIAATLLDNLVRFAEPTEWNSES